MKRILLMLPLLWGGNLTAQGLGAVLSSIQERYVLVNPTSIAWIGLPPAANGAAQFPTEKALANLGIEARIKLLAQAVEKFRSLCPRYLNVRTADILAVTGTKVGMIRPFTGVEFQPYGPIEPATYRNVLRKLALDVVRLRVLPAPSVTAQVTTTTDSFNRHQRRIGYNELETLDENNAPADLPANWKPAKIGISSNPTSTGTGTGTGTGELVDSINVSANYAEITDGIPLKSLIWGVTRKQVTEIAAGFPTGWTGGAVVALARVSWNPWSGTAPENSSDGAYQVVGQNSAGEAISVTQAGAGIEVTGGWASADANGNSGFIPIGFVFTKVGGNKMGFDWMLGGPGSVKVYQRDHVCLLVPTFVRGLDAESASNALAKLRKITPPPMADGQALPRPLPGMIFGIDLGPGLDDGTTSAWLAVVPSFSPHWFAEEALAPLGLGAFSLPFSWLGWRFDCVPALRFIGAEADYQVLYETSRASLVRKWKLPSCGTGNDVFLACGWNYQNKFVDAWDAPRVRQVVGKHLVADVTVTGGFSQVVKIYRRNGGTFTRTPGVAVDTSGLRLLRTLTLSNPSGLTGLGSGPEYLRISDNTGTNLDVSLAGMSNYRGDWEFKLTRSADNQTLWREIWDSDHTTNDITNTAQNWIAPHYTVSLTKDRAAAGTVTGLPGPCHVWPETPQSYTIGEVSVTWATTPTGRTTQVTGEPSLIEEWLPLSGFSSITPGGGTRIPSRIEQGPWKAVFSPPDGGVLKTELFLNSGGWKRWGTTWEKWTSSGASGDSVKLYSAPDGAVTAMDSSAVSWVRTDFGGLDGAAGTLPWEVKRVIAADGSGTLVTLNPLGDGSLTTITASGGFTPGSETTMIRGTKRTWSRDAAGYPLATSDEIFSGTSSVETGSALWLQTDKTAWGAPTGVKYSPSELTESWTYAADNRSLASWTDALGLTNAFTARDLFDRVTTGSRNGLGFITTYQPGGTGTDWSWGSGATAGTASRSVDAVGRPLLASHTRGGRKLSESVSRATGGAATVTREDSLTTAVDTFQILPDGALGAAAGNTLPFGGIEGTALTVADGLLKSSENLGELSAAFQSTWTDAWGRIRQIDAPPASGSGTSVATGTSYSPPGQSLKRVIVNEPSGRVLITESDPCNSSGAIIKSGIDKNNNGTLDASDRYTQSVTTIATGKLVTTLSLTENTGLREILRSEWTPSANQTITMINGNEETLTQTLSFITHPPLLYPTASVKVESSNGWTKTTALSNLGLADISTLGGTGIPNGTLDPTWRADGSLAGVSLNIGGAVHSATFNTNGTLATFNVPGRGNILGGHSYTNGQETLTFNGVKTECSLDGTFIKTSGGDTLGKSTTLTPSGSGFQEIIHPSIGSNTTIGYNAAGAATGKQYADASGESYTHSPGGLLESISLARGCSLEFGYSNDGAKDLTSAAWTEVSSGVFTCGAVAHGYSYDRAGRVDAIGDSSGVRSLGYVRGRLSQTAWNDGFLKGYSIVKHLSEYGRDRGFTLYRNGTAIHSATRVPNGLSGEISAVTSGNLKVVLARNVARQVTEFNWGNATSVPFDAVVTQTWTRGDAGRILKAESDVADSPSFVYLVDPMAPENSFDGMGRRLKCATAGGVWTYGYTAGQLTSAVHTTLGTFNYQFDGIGRRTDKGADNATDLLNRTLGWTHSQDKTLQVSANPDASIRINDTEVSDFSGSYRYAIPSPGPLGGWVPWVVRGAVARAGDPGANPDAMAEQSGAVWVPPSSERFYYDAAGNRQSSAQWDYGWDARNKLVRARTKSHNTAALGYDISFDYDAEGRRFRKIVTVYQNGGMVSRDLITFVWDGWDLIYERHQLPGGLTTLERKYVRGPDLAGGMGGDSGAGGAGGLLLIRETRGTQTTDYYPLYDGCGHVIGLADNNGTLVAEYAYGPFGELIHAKGPLAQSNPIRYATKYFDVETGLYDFGQRYLDPVTGQWLNREPLGEDESLNLYAYCHNDPVNNVDVLGLMDVKLHVEIACEALLKIKSQLGLSDVDFAMLMLGMAEGAIYPDFQCRLADIQDPQVRACAEAALSLVPLEYTKKINQYREVANWAPKKMAQFTHWMDKSGDRMQRWAMNGVLPGLGDVRQGVDNWWEQTTPVLLSATKFANDGTIFAKINDSHLGPGSWQHFMYYKNKTALQIQGSVVGASVDSFIGFTQSRSANNWHAAGFELGKSMHYLHDSYTPSHTRRDEKSGLIAGIYDYEKQNVQKHALYDFPGRKSYTYMEALSQSEKMILLYFSGATDMQQSVLGFYPMRPRVKIDIPGSGFNRDRVIPPDKIIDELKTLWPFGPQGH